MRKMGNNRDNIKAGGGRARGGRVSSRCDRKGHERMAGVVFIVAVCVTTAILIPMEGIVWKTEGVVSVDRRGEYLYNEDVSWDGRCSHDSEVPSPWCCVGKHGVWVVWTPILCR